MSLRLLKVIVQPIYIADDGEHLTEMVSDPVTVPAAEWPTFPDALEEARAQRESEM